MGKLIDLTGQRFGKLVVVELSEKRKYLSCDNKVAYTKVIWKCLCDCGNFHMVMGDQLKQGDCLSCGCSRYDGKGKKTVENMIISQTKNNAKNRNLEYSLSDLESKEIINQLCFYCGTFDIRKNRGKMSAPEYTLNGIDRIDPSKGYTKENCVPCCGRCNEAKMAESQPDFYAWIDRVYHHIHREDTV